MKMRLCKKCETTPKLIRNMSGTASIRCIHCDKIVTMNSVEEAVEKWNIVYGKLDGISAIETTILVILAGSVTADLAWYYYSGEFLFITAIAATIEVARWAIKRFF